MAISNLVSGKITEPLGVRALVARGGREAETSWPPPSATVQMVDPCSPTYQGPGSTWDGAREPDEEASPMGSASMSRDPGFR
jgi:hypothetical protein